MANSKKERGVLTKKISNIVVSNMPDNIPNSMPNNNMPENNNIAETPKSHKLPDEHCCKYCMKFDQFKEKCNVYWDNKKICTMKVKSVQEWNEERLMLGRP